MNNPAIPDKSILFEPVKDTHGSRLALVFGNESERGECPFYAAKQCCHCDIGAGEGTQFTPEMNRERLEFFKQHYGNALPGIKHLVIYNSGSTLNRREISLETMRDILSYASSLKKCKIVSFDSREMYVNENTLDYISINLREDQQVRIILGIETQDDGIRMGKLNKMMAKEKIEKAFAAVGRYGGKIGISVNIVFQPPELTGIDAILEAVETLRYGLGLGERYNVPVDFNLHPFYPSGRSRIMFPDHPRASLEDACRALAEMRKEIESRGSDAKLFIGWQDEEHDPEQGTRSRELQGYIERFHKFNTAQDKSIME